jgi:hypothetical protein
MPIDELVNRLESETTRRTVVKTGAKLAYIAPAVAASFKLSASSVGAQGASPVGCDRFNCGTTIDFCQDDLRCEMFSRPACVCTGSLEGSEFCGDWCFACGAGTGQGCTSSDSCPASWHCATTCCGNYCIPPCGTLADANSADSAGVQAVGADPVGTEAVGADPTRP